MSDARYTIRTPEAGLYIASWGQVGSTVEFTPSDLGNVRCCITSAEVASQITILKVLIISPPLKKGSEVVATIKGTLSQKYISLRPAVRLPFYLIMGVNVLDS